MKRLFDDSFNRLASISVACRGLAENDVSRRPGPMDAADS
jgi:hypothetical protein